MPFLFERIRETFLFEILLSALFALLFYYEVLASTYLGSTIIMLTLVGFILAFWRKCLIKYFVFAEEKSIYYKTNFLTLSVFAAVNLVFAFADAEPYYTWLFLPYKLFTHLGLNKFLSALIIHFAKIIFILWTPQVIVIKD